MLFYVIKQALNICPQITLFGSSLSLLLYVHKCKLFSFYKAASFVMPLFGYLGSCLLYLLRYLLSVQTDRLGNKSREQTLELFLILHKNITEKIGICTMWVRCTSFSFYMRDSSESRESLLYFLNKYSL